MIIYADHLSDNDLLAADVLSVFMALAIGVTVYVLLNFLMGLLRIPLLSFAVSLVVAIITVLVVYFALRNSRTEVADWWNRNVGANR